ncbi:hypothetical protein CBM2633_U50002 [Cupriavidus taiwanensis]|uniref:Uncharacterized protein n=2 Tax=Cupriavidus TaxID=106589 RepID=A0A375CSL2_9BURK|nr:hypothetical protein CBM2589_U70006 [Cupriavidus taiwanensis]SPD62266.1 protein of unknown function [Cupriavidus neocaledonicus]SOY78381.1 hypothetical protein CBM2586_U40002 [Cupriavidus taiwanensis]SOZ07310.1 hypothetical protein CBM2599_U40002 [Cupriavidus taiwanensis]SOZ19595.1 hypothetical protein CBM2597_U90006 [Cupriavidus taiwanensis]
MAELRRDGKLYSRGQFGDTFSWIISQFTNELTRKWNARGTLAKLAKFEHHKRIDFNFSRMKTMGTTTFHTTTQR